MQHHELASAPSRAARSPPERSGTVNQTTTRGALLLAALSLIALAPMARAQEAAGAVHVVPASAEASLHRAAPEPSRVPEVLRLAPARQAAPSALEALATQPVVPGVPYRNGFARTVPPEERRRVAIPAGATARTPVAAGEIRSGSDGISRGIGSGDAGAATSWVGRVVVEGSYAFRVLLRDVHLPEGVEIWLDAGATHLGPYGLELLDPDGNLWLPPVPGPEAVVEIVLPPAATEPPAPSAFTLGEVMELVAGPQALGPEPFGLEPKVWTDCDVDAQCVDTNTVATIDQLEDAIALLTFVDGGVSYQCTGGMLNDTDTSDFRPYLLTANHCFDTQASASSLVAYFDYRTASCNGTAPSLGSVPSVAGATLLASDPTSDFTFVELSGNPSGLTWYLGWTASYPSAGETMNRVSHPEGTPQKFSQSSYEGDAGLLCTGLSTTNFLYSGTTVGSTSSGSSGAPVTVDVSGDARVVGQLLGACHTDPWDDCSYETYSNVDGAFAVTYPNISQWLNPTPPCSADGYEPDDSSGQASPIASGSSQAHSLCPAGDEDWASFTLGDESGVEIETSGPSGDTRMWLYDASLAQIELDDDSGSGLFSLIDRPCGDDPLPAGTYYVRVDEYGDDDPIDDYDLAYTRIASCSGSCVNDLTLSNDTLSGTQSFRANTTITLGPSLLVDGPAIDLIAGQSIVISSGTVIGGSFSAGTDPAACGL
jgi:hypothetical protein